MPLRFPPRREPRVLALVRVDRGFHYATADPWELRGTGSVDCEARALAPSIARLVRREKPTIAVTRSPALREPMRRACRRYGIAVGAVRHPGVPLPIARDLYPELPLRAPTPSLEVAGALAIAAVLYAKNTHRHYAPRRKRSPEHAA